MNRESLKDYKKHLKSLKDYKKYLKLFNYKEEDTQEIIRKLFVGGLIYILVKNLFPIIINDIPFYGVVWLLIFLLSIINFVGILIILSGVCNVIYKVLKLIDLLIESKKEKL